jgi:tyrosinase
LEHRSSPFVLTYSKRSLFADAPDFYESSFWKDSNPRSGLGGWGDPNADYSVTDGGFSKLQLSYPIPHTLSRNFTLRPFDLPFLVFDDPTLEANTSFLASAVEKILEIPYYKEFQKEVEAVVRNLLGCWRMP